MTNREFYEAVMALENVSTEISDFAKAGIAKLDTRNASRSSKPSKLQMENAPLIEKIREYLFTQTKAVTASAIGTELKLGTNKVASLAKKIEGIEIVELKVKGRKVNGYRLSAESDSTDEVDSEADNEVED